MQVNLFTDDTSNYISISEAATLLMVSTATIRNWIKTGYISLLDNGKISSSSIDTLKKEVIGKDKLTQRANKSQKDTHDHQKLLSEFLENVKTNEINSSLWGECYESNLSDSYRNQEGIYYTPDYIVNDLLPIDYQLENKTFCDPCCGSGNFIMRAIELGCKPENVFGFDTDPIAVEITKQRIYEKTGYKTTNILCTDFLEHSVSNKFMRYDLMFTNPPWGKKTDKSEKTRIAKLLNSGASTDTSSLFFFACLDTLNVSGKLGLLVPDAFFNVATYEDARKKALTCNIERLKDYGKAFRGLQTGAVAIVLSKQSPIENNEILCDFNNSISYRSNESFKKNPKCIFNISCSYDESELIDYLFKIPHLTLKNNAQWGLGIVTGNNSKFIEDQPRNGLISVFKGSDITRKGIKEPSNFIPEDLSLYQQVAPLYMFQAREKLIYKFISSDLVFYHDTDKKFVLNSANMLVVNGEFPVNMKILKDFFNSDLINWLFKRIFNTYKVLRSDIECIPIHAQFLSGDFFSEEDYLKKLNVERLCNGTFGIKK